MQSAFWLRAAMAVCCLSSPLLAEENAGDFFRKQVEPILVRRCLECHAAEGRGGLDLRTKAALAKGGESGAVLVAGNPEDSLLFEYVSTGKMPPKRPLPAQEIAALKIWIERGGPFPDGTLDPYAFTSERRAGYDWWALRPIVKPTPPQRTEAGRDVTDGLLSPIDAFLVDRLRAEGLSFSAPAGRAVYLRRLMDDLHGLPPTFEEVQEFEHDSRPDAYERLVDRLLASPRYGERWGRHWLDVIRFAESNGFERDRLRPNFWRFRDYVIDAFNRDLPYDQFVREQLAGDALRPGDPQALVATGFLVAGPKNDVGTISELEQLTTRQDELDEYVVATGTTFLGLTIGCARCHDHKFDPIPSRDYYALTAVFSGLDRADNPVAPPEVVAHHELAVQQVARIKGDIGRLLGPVRTRLAAELATAQPKSPAQEPGKLPMVTVERNEDAFPPVPARFVRMLITATTSGTQPCLDELEVFGEDSKLNLALAGSGAKAAASSLLPGYPIHQIAHLNDGRYGNGASWISNEPGTGWARIEFPKVTSIQRVVWGRDRESKYTDRLAMAYKIEVSIDGMAWTAVSSSERRVPYRKTPASADQIPEAQVVAALQSNERVAYDRLAQGLQSAEGALRQLPPLPVSYSVRDAAPRDAFVLKRGNVRDQLERVPPAALAAVPGLDARLQPADAARDSGPERRRRLAEWIVDSRNPLTPRVIVNRLWHYHFGQGISSTPSDLGFNGDRPSHPELLDWLAADFVAHGWRLKRLHKQIVLSRAYRQSSNFRPEAAAKDGGNRLLWRMTPRRLDSEALRDAVLFTSGKLDPTMGGPSFRLFEYRDGNVPDYVLRELPGRETWRRTVYMFNIRTFHEPLMSVFDCPDPSVQTPSRERSTTALQALSLMNNAFVFEQAKHFAERAEALAGENASVEQQVRAAYRLAYAREPTSAETAQATEFVKRTDLFSLCRVLLNTNEFLYVR